MKSRSLAVGLALALASCATLRGTRPAERPLLPCRPSAVTLAKFSQLAVSRPWNLSPEALRTLWVDDLDAGFVCHACEEPNLLLNRVGSSGLGNCYDWFDFSSAGDGQPLALTSLATSFVLADFEDARAAAAAVIAGIGPPDCSCHGRCADWYHSDGAELGAEHHYWWYNQPEGAYFNAKAAVWKVCGGWTVYALYSRGVADYWGYPPCVTQ